MADVLTHHNDTGRTGMNPAETVLTPANVNVQSFGELFERHVEGDVYAQILYVRGVGTPHGAKNLFYVATSTNRVYAFDADDVSQDPKTPPVWSRQLDPARSLTSQEICRETVGSVGITSTPVIDAQTRTIYVVTRSSAPQPGVPGDGANYLHAVDIATGADKPSSPVHVAASLPGTGPEAGGTIVFNARCQRNRPGLLLLNGVVYLAYGTFSCDQDCGPGEPYHGWVL